MTRRFTKSLFRALETWGKNLFEIAYRLSLIEIGLEMKTLDEGFLMLETSEEALDVTYRDNMVKILSSVKKNGFRFVVTNF
jgi:hypothetical protein